VNGFQDKENVMRHAVNWFEIPVADLTRAVKFYETMTGRTIKREFFGPPGEEMGMFETGDDQAVGGCLLSSPNAKPAADGTTVYLNAEPSIDAWLGRVKPAGGQVVVPKTALPEGMGFFAHIIDSEGNRVGLHAMA
jgi:uncharacterized protein